MARKARKANPAKTPISLDTSYVRAVPLLPRNADTLHIILVGCGGSGSWLAPSIARLAVTLREADQNVDVTFVDFDVVEESNVLRQNFCYAEIGQLKAEALATRYTQAWGMPITAIGARFNPALVKPGWNDVAVVVGCVDNAAARKKLASTLRENRAGDPPHRFWLDCGNGGFGKPYGQVLLGSAASANMLRYAFPIATVCHQLPSPALQHPELLVALPEESSSAVSCDNVALANAQALMINQMVAAVAADYLIRLTTGGLTRFATYFDQDSGSARSRYITPDTLATVVGKEAGMFELSA